MKFLVWIGIAMVICWAILWLGIKMAIAAVHLLLLLGAVLIVWGLVKRGRSDVDQARR
jgi:high-affinity Fe2+/Pb2+ permease